MGIWEVRTQMECGGSVAAVAFWESRGVQKSCATLRVQHINTTPNSVAFFCACTVVYLVVC